MVLMHFGHILQDTSLALLAPNAEDFLASSQDMPLLSQRAAQPGQVLWLIETFPGHPPVSSCVLGNNNKDTQLGHSLGDEVSQAIISAWLPSYLLRHKPKRI